MKEPTTKSGQESRKASKAAETVSRDATISETDLRGLPVKELLALKERIDGILAETDLARMKEYDLLLEYDIRIRDVNGVRSSNNGTTRLNGILHPRALASAPGRLEEVFESQVFSPLNSDVYDIIDEAGGEGSKGIRGMGSMLPVYDGGKPVFNPVPLDGSQTIEGRTVHGGIS